MSPRGPIRVKTLTIDGREVGAREDQTILEVARENNIFIRLRQKMCCNIIKGYLWRKSCACA